jgi:hypothetical protein
MVVGGKEGYRCSEKRLTHFTLPYPVFPSTSAITSSEARLSSTKDHLLAEEGGRGLR